MRMTSALIVLGFALAACSGSGGEGDTAAEPEEQAAGAQEQAADGAESASIGDSMTEAVEKAEDVEDTAMEHKQAVDDAVESAEDETGEPAAKE